MILPIHYVTVLVQIFCFQTLVSAFWGSSPTQSPPTTRAPTTPAPIVPPTTPPPPAQIAQYVGLDGLYRQFKDVNEKNAMNAAGTLFTIGTNTAAFGTNLLNEIVKLNKASLEALMASETNLLDGLINANQAVQQSSQRLLNGTHTAIRSDLNRNIKNWDLVTDMFATGAKNAVSGGAGGSSAINIQTSFG
ncbi:hypothetical protein M8J76_004545 [Diaphorina citri]|nr:hypothetical protein M8J76_004545 [Diaphorina citri]